MRALSFAMVAATFACAPAAPSPPTSYYGMGAIDDAAACGHARQLLEAHAASKGYQVGPPDPDCVPELKRIAGLDPRARECRALCMMHAETFVSMHVCFKRQCPTLPRAVLRRPENEPDPGPAPGGLNRPNDVVARNRWRFKECFVDALEVDNAAHGNFQIAVTVSSTGVVGATVVGTDGPPALTECIRRSFTFMRFDPSTDEASAHFTVPVALSSVSAPTPK